MPDITEITYSGAVKIAEERSLDEDWDSAILDFKNMLIGSVHVFWPSPPVGSGGVFELFVGNVPDPDYLVPFEAFKEVDATCPGHLFNMTSGFVGFRYGQLRYTKGDQTSGSFTAVAVGKRHGGIV